MMISDIDIHLLSDIHLELYKDKRVWSSASANKHVSALKSLRPKSTEHSVCVLAGDIGIIGRNGVYEEWIRHCAKYFGLVIVVTGNHEYYGCQSMAEVERQVS